MYKECRTAQSAARQRQIIDSLFWLLRTQSYDEITVSQLCRQAGMPRKAFYRYFDGIGDVLDAAVDFLLLKFSDFPTVEPGADPARMEQALEEVFAFALERRELLAALDRAGLTGRLMQQIIRKTYASAARRRTPFPAESPNIYRITHYFTSCSLLILLTDWLQRGCPEPPAQMAATVMHLFRAPLWPEP